MTGEPLPPELQRVHMVGIGGAGMSGIARILLDRGGLVSGSDAKESRSVHALRARGAVIRSPTPRSRSSAAALESRLSGSAETGTWMNGTP